jgi:hypothetical protein
MFYLRRLLYRCVVAVFLTACSTAASGCIPVTWLPDSSGFVYVKRHPAKGPKDLPAIQLLHFDLKKNTSRVVVDRVVSNTNWPAVSPDGKRLAVARFARGVKEGWTVQVVIYDLGGKQLHESKRFEWPADGTLTQNSDSPSFLFWSPKDDRVVVTSMMATGIYNVGTAAMETTIEQSAPLIHGGTPIRPDGKGCLLLVDDGGPVRLTFVQWDGNERTLNIKPLAALLPNLLGRQENENRIGDIGLIVHAPLLCPSWWDDNAAVVGGKRGKATIRYDTAKKSVAITVPKKDSESFRQLLKEAFGTYDISDDVSIRVVGFSEKKADSEGAIDFNRVVIVHHKSGKEHTLLAKEAPCVFPIPSPDGRNLALNFYGSKVVPTRTVVISAQGELVGKIDIPE